ncbi:MAG TPA: hypothetical protein VJV05_02505 [Pyrinomonadaceae bacterium]|nr:hypothetical protein [Pyrinomonadaceae bacterium]
MKRSTWIIGLVLLVVSGVSAQSDIRKVDFKNFTYPVLCIGQKATNITVKDGEYLREKQEDGYVDRFSFNVFDVNFGDVTGDQIDEAIILGSCNTGGTGNFSEGFIYSMKAAKPSLIARIPGGDRAYGGLRETRTEAGKLVVESNDPGVDGAACCPQRILMNQYRVSGGKLVKVGKEMSRDIFPTERIKFAAGTSGKSWSVDIPRQEGKRFIIGARAGQTLTVSVNTDQASLRLLDEADTKFGVNNFLVKLPRNGDYTIEVQNNADGPLTVEVNVKIQ